MMFPSTHLLINRYRILETVGQGSQGSVYKARDETLDRIVAIKSVLHDEASESMLSEEARLLASLEKHPVLPSVFDYFSEDGHQLLVMEFVSGDDLAKMLKLRGTAFPIERILAWGDRLLSALEHIHANNPPIIHRDIKPQNMKLNRRDEIVLLDFGLAKNLIKGTFVSGFTATYAPIEQLRGLRTDERSDLYALSASLYHLGTNTKPVDALTRRNVLDERLPDPLVAPHLLEPSISQEVSLALMQAMSLDQTARPSSAAEFRHLLINGENTVVKSHKNERASRAVDIVTHPAKPNAARSSYRILGYARGHILSLAFSPDGRSLASGSWDKQIALWDLQNGTGRILAQCDGPVNSVSFSPDGGILTSAGRSIDLWDVKTGECLKRLNQSGLCVAFSNDGRHLAWARTLNNKVGGEIWIWRTGNAQPEILGASDRWVRWLAFSPDDQTLVSASHDVSRPICLWNLQNKRSRVLRANLQHGPDAVDFTAGGKIIACAGKVITLLDLKGKLIREMGSHDDNICSIAISPDGKKIASVGRAVCCWNTDTGQKQELRKCDNHINAVAFSSDGITIAAGGNDRAVILLRL